MKKFYFIFCFLSLTSCGEAVFYKHIQYLDGNSLAVEKMESLILSVSTSLGYETCKLGYCKSNSSFSVKEVSANGFELVFNHSFGSYPGSENTFVDLFSAKLAEKCSRCTIKTKESSVWGFVDNESDWTQIHP